MIKVNIARDKSGFIWEYTVQGHAEAGEHGNDVVCAAVSAIAFTGINALSELLGIQSFSKQSGYMKCTIPTDISEDKKHTARVILDTIAVGFKQIEYTPGYRKYIRVLDEEV